MTAQRPPKVSLVIPVYDVGRFQRSLGEIEEFLDCALFKAELIIVDDRCPGATTPESVRRFATRPEVRLLQNDRNRGKGFSVARGMQEARGDYRVFTDADLAYPLAEVWRIVSTLEGGADVAIACRVLKDSQYEMRSSYLRYLYTRHVLSRAFNKLVRVTLLPGAFDTQAGLKGYTAAAARDVFSRIRIAGFGFDLECLFVARLLNLRVEQVPVRFRYQDEPSTVRFLRDAGTMAADLARIRWRGWTGEYVTAVPASSRAVPQPAIAPTTSPPLPPLPPLASREREVSVS
jgi:dolichyl-phosphate beta-glucosyltransferase